METISLPMKLYFLPFLAPGHMIPLFHIARIFASLGEHVTMILTPSNAKLLTKTIDQDRANYGSHIHIHIINFPSNEVGLPVGFENMSLATDNDSAAKICTAADLLKPQVEALFKANPPHVFVVDIMFRWSKQLVSELGIPRVVFNPMSIFVSCMADAMKRYPPQPQPLLSESGFVIQGLPHPIILNVKPSPGFTRMMEDLIEDEKNSVGVILNSFKEVEEEYSEHYEKLTGRKVWHVGPALLMLKNNTNIDMDLFGDDQQKHECVTWLNKQEPKSVVYISFGSLCRFVDQQLFEIACGMEASGHKFLWVVHRKHDNDDDSKWLPSGFEARMKQEDRMMILEGWAPQVLILNHPAIGGFLTHSAWNAMAEAISAGVPLITMPGFADQYYNEKLITQVRGFGVEVGGQTWNLSPYSERKKLVRRERIEAAVTRLMNGGDEADRVKTSVKELQEKARKAVEQDGSSHSNVLDMLHQIKQIVFKNGKLLEHGRSSQS